MCLNCISFWSSKRDCSLIFLSDVQTCFEKYSLPVQYNYNQSIESSECPSDLSNAT